MRNSVSRAVFCVVCIIVIMSPSIVFAKTDSYEAILTRHLAKHQKYPISGKLYGLEGDVIIRLQIDRFGNIIKHKMVHTSDNPVLNKAVNDMIKLANPAPRPPDSYFKDQNAVEFMLPIAFRTKENFRKLQGIDKLFRKKSKEAWNK